MDAAIVGFFQMGALCSDHSPADALLTKAEINIVGYPVSRQSHQINGESP